MFKIISTNIRNLANVILSKAKKSFKIDSQLSGFSGMSGSAMSGFLIHNMQSGKDRSVVQAAVYLSSCSLLDDMMT